MQWPTSESIIHISAIVPVTITIVSLYTIQRFIRNRIERQGYPLPPGPIPLPLLGSALSVGFDEPFRTYTNWRKKYGDIMYIRLLDMDVVVLNSLSITADLFEKRSQIYSNRPFIATIDPYGHDSNFALTQYGNHWRLCRRIFHQTFGPDAAPSFHPMQIRTARQMVWDIIDDPNGCAFHFSTFASAVIMSSVYDYNPSPRNDRMVSNAYNFLKISIPALLPERAILLKFFPFLLHVPDWFIGSSFKHEARESREWGTKMIEEPYEYTKRQMESKNFNPSMVSDHITRMEKFDDSYRSKYEMALKHASSTAFLASVESTSSLLMSFVVAMVKNPRVWKRAQTEIDAIVGVDRLPEFHDRTSLPYIDAIMRETMRWQPPAPLAAPHATATSDIYNGFYIPKGATVFGNIWAITRDENRYPNAEEFIPERFLDSDNVLTDDKAEFIYGFGRRICPGRYTADASLWSAMVMMLATLDFNLAKDADGKDIIFEAKFTNGIARRPMPFHYNITPRPHINRASLETGSH